MADGGKKESEENVITPEEFKELEKSEGKKIKLKGASKKEHAPEPGPARREGGTDMEMLLLKTEKLEGKIEAISDFREAVDERFSGINQEIGELRSSVMEKDRIIRDIQKGFTEIREIGERLEPDKILGELAKKDESIEKNQAEIERVALQIKEIRNELKAISGVLENIRDIKKVIGVVHTFKEKMVKINEDRKFTSRTASKIETMFSELSDNLAEFQSYKDKIAFSEETIHEVMKSVDMLETRLDGTAKKDDVKGLDNSLETKMEKMKTEMEDRLYEVKNLVDNLLATLKQSGIKGVLESVGKSKLDRMFATKNDMEGIKKRLDRLGENVRERQGVIAGKAGGVSDLPHAGGQKIRDEPKAGGVSKEAADSKDGARPVPEARARIKTPPAPPRRDIPTQQGPEGRPPSRDSTFIATEGRLYSLMDQAEDAIKIGNFDVAKKLYREALSLYDQLNEAEGYQDVNILYDRVKRLYSRLRIYT